MIDHYATVPESIKESIDLYVNHRCSPGSFLTAVLENDLMTALKYGDKESLKALPEIGKYLYNEVRGDCYGTPEKVHNWLAYNGDSRAEFIFEY